MSLFFLLISNEPITFFYSDPGHAADVIVDHEPQSVEKVGLVCCLAKDILVSNLDALFHHGPQPGDVLWMANINLEELLLILLIVHNC